MTQPSVVLDSIRSVLATRLGSAVKEVRIIDGEYGTEAKDLKEFISVPTPSVIVACLGFVMGQRMSGATVAHGHFVCWCVSRLPDMPAKDTRGDVAADLASAVFFYANTERWDGKASKNSERLRSTNLHSTELARQGVAIWAVDWFQSFEITPETVAATLNDLRKIHYTFNMGTAETPKIEAEQNDLQGVP